MRCERADARPRQRPLCLAGRDREGSAKAVGKDQAARASKNSIGMAAAGCFSGSWYWARAVVLVLGGRWPSRSSQGWHRQGYGHALSHTLQ